MLDALHLIREAARAGELDLVFGLVLAVAAAALRLPEDGGGQGVLTRDLGDIVDDAVFVDEVLRLKVAGEDFVFEAERDARVDDGLTAQRFDIVVGGNVDIGKHVEVGQPARARAGFAAAVGRLDPELIALFAHGLAALKVQGVFVPVAPDGHVHIARGILRRARAEAVEAEGVFVVVAVQVVVLAAGIELAVHELPVEALFLGVIVHRAAAAHVLYFDAVV